MRDCAVGGGCEVSLAAGYGCESDLGSARAASPLARSSIRHDAIRSVTGVHVGVARSRLPIAVPVIVATTAAHTVAIAERNADPDAKVRTSQEASAVVVASAGVDPSGVKTAVSAAIDAACVRGRVAARNTGIAVAHIGSGIAAATVGRSRIAVSTAA